MRGTNSIRTALAAIAGVLFGLSPLAHAASPTVSYLTPTGFQRGTSTTVTVTGDRLLDCEGLLFSDPGIVLEGFDSKEAKKVVAKINVAPEVSLGLHYLRVRTATGVSAMRPFFIGQFPQIDEAEPNTAPSDPQIIELGSGVTVQGLTASEDTDYYQIKLKKGQVLNIEMEAWRLGYTIFDPVIAILDKDGNELAQCDDSRLLGQDPVLHFVAPADADYLIEVMDSAFAASNGRYRIHFGNYPRPTSVFPRAAQVGTKNEFIFLLPDGSTAKQTFKMPAEANSLHPLFFSSDSTSAPSANSIVLSDHPHVIESGENNTRQTGLAVPFPGVYSGAITESSQDDYFTVTLKKDTDVIIRAHARSLRSPLDTSISIYDTEGKTVASNDDLSTGILDSTAKFKVPADGDYAIRIYDKMDRFGPEYTYCIEAVESTPSLAITFPEFSNNNSYTRQYIVIPRGGRFASRINIRRNKQGGDLEFRAPNLPAAVSLVNPGIPDNLGNYPVIFEAAADAPLGGSLSALHVAAPNNGPIGSLSQRFQFMKGPPGNTTFYQLSVEEYPVVVCDEAPFEISLSRPPIPVVQNGRIPITVTATRKEGFEKDIKLHYLWNSPNVTSPQEVTMKADADVATFNLDAKVNASTGEWTAVVMGSAAVDGGGTVYNAAAPITYFVEEPFVIGKVPMGSVTRGDALEVRVQLEQKREFAGNATAELLGLPTNTTAPPVEFNKDATEIVFAVQTAENSPAGTHKSLVVRVQVPSGKDEHSIVHNFAHGSVLRIDKPRDPVAAAAE